jgi:hypothetical protein
LSKIRGGLFPGDRQTAYESRSRTIWGGCHLANSWKLGETLLFQFGNLGKSLIEERRRWMVLRKTDTSKSVTSATTWQTQTDLSTITAIAPLGIRPGMFPGGNTQGKQHRG